MCFSAAASFGAAVALLPAGAYCIETAWRKDRRYLPLAVVPLFFGLQQLCEAVVWHGLDQGHPDVAEAAGRAYLFFALALWPVWTPLASLAIESRRPSRIVFALLSVGGLAFAFAQFYPFATGHPVAPEVSGHSIHYNLTVVPAARTAWSWIWMALYLATVSVPLLAAGNRDVRPLGFGVLGFALISVLVFDHAFASVWCFFAAILSVYLAIVIRRIPGDSHERPEPSFLPVPSN